ncbi:MAG: hypothetical protein EA369_03800 [Bradymonadales bacterium]|nr:MAG: hypothetical protein EA369_03800 [Bradymonadales bacterium]
MGVFFRRNSVGSLSVRCLAGVAAVLLASFSGHFSLSAEISAERIAQILDQSLDRSAPVESAQQGRRPQVLTEAPYGPVPLLWHLRISGAELAREPLSRFGGQAARVIVMDDRIDDPRATQLPFPELPDRRLRFRFMDFLSGTPTGDRMSNDRPADLEFASSWLETLLLEEIVIPDFKSPLPRIQSDHGIHVAGTIGGLELEIGTSPNVELFAFDAFQGNVRHFPQDFPYFLESLLEFPYANFIVNMSLQLPASNDYLRAAQRVRTEKNANLVIAAGNDGKSLGRGWIADKTEGAFVVGAIGPWGGVASFSNYGRKVRIMAPGVDIASRLHSRAEVGASLGLMSGTSMAAPLASGALANLRVIFPEEPAELLEEILERTAWKLERKSQNWGRGLINVYKATLLAIRLSRVMEAESISLAEALRLEELFDFSREIRRARIEEIRAPRHSEAYRRSVYRQVLLSDDMSEFERMSEFYSRNFNFYSEGLRFLSYNYQDFCEEDELLLAYTQHAMWLQRSLLAYHPENLGVFASLQSPKLIRSVLANLHRLGRGMEERVAMMALFPQLEELAQEGTEVCLN